MKRETTFGHSCYAIMAPAIYALKSEVSFEGLKRNALSCISTFNQIKEDNPFTKEDVLSAPECYDIKYKTFPRDDLEKITAIFIPINKRNYRTQEMHVKGARVIQKINNPKWREGNGRSSKEDEVKVWREKNPNGRKIDCRGDTGLDPKTIRKWWDSEAIR